MRAPKSWIAEYVNIPASITDQQISDALVRVGFEVEEIIVQGEDLTGPLVVGKVLAIEELKEHKKPIRYVELDCGEGQSRFVICGAQNFAVGDLIVASLPGAALNQFMLLIPTSILNYVEATTLSNFAGMLISVPITTCGIVILYRYFHAKFHN